jgi:hypothetical protein
MLWGSVILLADTRSSCDGKLVEPLSPLVSLDAVYWRAKVLAFSLQGAGTGSECDERVHWTGTLQRYKLPGTAAGTIPNAAMRQQGNEIQLQLAMT